MTPPKPQKKRKPRTLAEIRRAVADYIASEGCGCCGNREGHEEARTVLAKLLRVPPHPKQNDWHDFSPYQTKSRTF